MSDLGRAEAVDRLEEIVDAVENERMPVPVREVWAFGDVALGLDPVDRLDVYLTKDILVRDDSATTGSGDVGDGIDSSRTNEDPDAAFRDSHGVEGVGKSVRADWATAYPEYLRANANGHAAPKSASRLTCSRRTNRSTSRSVTPPSRTTSPSACAGRNCARITLSCSTPRGLSLGRRHPKRRGVPKASRE